MKAPAGEHYPTAYEVIFSCSICQATINDIYGHNGTKSDASNDRLATKLWLTECAHLTCGKHLDGGGAPFHPESQHPKAPCPRCQQQSDDDSPKKLFGIRGWKPEEHDKAIPDAWFDTPPLKLDSSTPGSEALRFQYLSLISFGTKTLHRLRALQNSCADDKRHLVDAATAKKRLEEELKKTQDDILRLQAVEVEYNRFKQKEPQIRHYLGVLSFIARENDHLKSQLTTLGYKVPQTSYAFIEKESSTLAPNRSEAPDPRGEELQYQVNTTHEKRQRTVVTERENAQPEMGSGSDRTLSGYDNGVHDNLESSSKRRRLSSPRRSEDRARLQSRHFETINGMPASRDLMPPPPKVFDSAECQDRTFKSSAPRAGLLDKAHMHVNPHHYMMTGALPAQSQQSPTPQPMVPRPSPIDTSSVIRNRHTQLQRTPQHSQRQEPMPFLEPVRPPTMQAVERNRDQQISSQHVAHTSQRDLYPRDQSLPYTQGLQYGQLPVQIRGGSSQYAQDPPLADINTKTNQRYTPHQQHQQLGIESGPNPWTQPYQHTTLRTPANRSHMTMERRPEPVASPFFSRAKLSAHSSHQVLPSGAPAYEAQVFEQPMQFLNSWIEPRSLNGLSFISSPRNASSQRISEVEPYLQEQQVVSDLRVTPSRLTLSTPRNGDGLFYRPGTMQQPNAVQSRPAGVQTYGLPSAVPSYTQHSSPYKVTRNYARQEADPRTVIPGARIGTASSRLPYRQRPIGMSSSFGGHISADRAVLPVGRGRRNVMR